jgi:hypothetical protein
MKTGYDSTDNTMEERIKRSGAHLLNELMVYAIKNACAYAKSAGRDNMSGKDIIIALQYEAHEFIYRNHSQENDDTESEESDSDEESVNESEDSDEFTRSYSEDPLIQKMNYYHDTWDSWEPEVPIEKTIKNAVNEAIKLY